MHFSVQILAAALFLGTAPLALSQPEAPVETVPPLRATPLAPAQLRGQIAYAVQDGLWVVNPQTGKQTLLFAQLFADRKGGNGIPSAAWTPDRRYVVFTFQRANLRLYTGNELYVMRWDGKGRRRLTNTKFLLASLGPRLSPDGKRVLYMRSTGYRMGGPGYTGTEIRVVNLDGSGDRRVVGDINNHDTGTTGAYWSRDGKRIVFRRYKGNPDYAAAHDVPVSFKTIALNGKGERPFNGDWSRYDVPWVSRDGRFAMDFKLLPGGFRSDWQVRQPNGLRTAFQPSDPTLRQLSPIFFVAPQAAQVAFTASAPNFYGRGLWISGLDGQSPRLLAKADGPGVDILAWL